MDETRLELLHLIDGEAASLPTIVAETTRQGWQDKALACVSDLVAQAEIVADDELTRLARDLDKVRLEGRAFDRGSPGLPRVTRLCGQIRDRVLELRLAGRT